MRRFNAVEKGRLLKRRAGGPRSGYRLLVNLRVLRVEVEDRADRGARRQVFAMGGWPLLLLRTWTIAALAALAAPATLFGRVVRIIIGDVVLLELPLP
jgi:hypothetical protein